MTEQELRESLISVAPSAIYANESEIVAIVEIAKAYADARESKEIAELKATNNLSSIGWRKDCEARDLKIDQLNAEIKRLRGVAQRARQYCEYGNGCGGATKLPSGEWFDEGEGTLYHAVLSVLPPAPVTEGDMHDLPVTDALCPKCGSHRTEILGVGINANTIYKCWECKNEFE